MDHRYETMVKLQSHAVFCAHLLSCTVAAIIPNNTSLATAMSTTFRNVQRATYNDTINFGNKLDERENGSSHKGTTAQYISRWDGTPQTTHTVDVITRPETIGSNITKVNQTACRTMPDAESWLDPLFWFHLIVSVIGVVANTITLSTLVKNGDMFSPAIRFLLRHQSLVDLSVCVLAPIFLLQPPMWITNCYCIDVILCHIWHSQLIYWAAIYLSAFNLAAISVERYIAVCHPMKHRRLAGDHLRCILFSMYFFGGILCVPGSLQVLYNDGYCTHDYLIRGRLGENIYFAYSVLWFVFIFVLPVTIYCILYGRVIATLRRRTYSESMPRADVLGAAQSNLTKTALLLTSIFAITVGFDACAYLLGNIGVIQYKIGSTFNKLGLFFTLFNSVVNPFVYAGFMPRFRMSLLKTFCCCTVRIGDVS